MWITKVLLTIIFALSLLTSSIAEEDNESSSVEEYGKPDEITIRMFPKIFSRGKSDGSSSVASQPVIQQYWHNIMRNIPSFRWNMTNSLGNLFNGGTQEEIKTPVGYQEVNRKRKRKNSNLRKSSIRPNKSRRRSGGNSYNSYNYAQGQLQLQPLGMDENNVMHFYEPRSGQYYALHMVSSPNYQYGQQHRQQAQQPQQHYYNPHQSAYGPEVAYHDSSYGSNEEQNEESGYEQQNSDDNRESSEDTDDDDTYDPLSSPDRGYNYQDPHNYRSEYTKYAESAVESANDYADDIQVVDNWGYSDDEIFGERKLKLALTPISLHSQTDKDQSSHDKGLKSDIVKIERSQLDPETNEEVMLFLANKQRERSKKHKSSMRPMDNFEENDKPIKRLKHYSSKKSNEDSEVESMRNLMGSYMKDDELNRKRQRSTTKTVKRPKLVETPRQMDRYHVYPQYW